MKVPFNDLNLQYQGIKDEIDNVISDVIEKSAFVRGPYVEEFEINFAKLFQTDYCVSCGNGTDAIYIALRALNIKQGDEVIVPSHSWISTSQTVTQAGGKVVFCDTDKDDYTLDPKFLTDKLSNKTVGIIPVHLFGQPANMEAIMEFSRKHNLWVIEDCAQAHLASYKDQLVGTFGNMATYSFYPGKNLGAFGDAGAIVTNDEILSQTAAMLARHGGLTKGEHRLEGMNSRLDGIQAAILNVKLKYLNDWTIKRQKIAERYLKNLEESEMLNLPIVKEDRRHVWHLFVIKTYLRDELKKYLSNKGIDTVINYPVSLPFLPAYGYLNHKPSDFPISFKNQSEILSLPIFPDMTFDQVDYVCEQINQFFRNP
jgi:dTDP-4-amino-4,6-dideoxygalactose transaminase